MRGDRRNFPYLHNQWKSLHKMSFPGKQNRVCKELEEVTCRRRVQKLIWSSFLIELRSHCFNCIHSGIIETLEYIIFYDLSRAIMSCMIYVCVIHWAHPIPASLQRNEAASSVESVACNRVAEIFHVTLARLVIAAFFRNLCAKIMCRSKNIIICV